MIGDGAFNNMASEVATLKRKCLAVSLSRFPYRTHRPAPHGKRRMLLFQRLSERDIIQTFARPLNERHAYSPTGCRPTSLLVRHAPMQMLYGEGLARRTVRSGVRAAVPKSSHVRRPDVK